MTDAEAKYSRLKMLYRNVNILQTLARNEKPESEHEMLALGFKAVAEGQAIMAELLLDILNKQE
jgi:hypothetical protein